MEFYEMIKKWTKYDYFTLGIKAEVIIEEKKYGVLCADGRLITDISLLKDAVFLISKIT